MESCYSCTKAVTHLHHKHHIIRQRLLIGETETIPDKTGGNFPASKGCRFGWPDTELDHRFSCIE